MFRLLYKKINRTIIPMLFLSVLVGFLTAFIVYLYNYTLEHIGEWSKSIYGYVSTNLAFLPLLILGVAALALFVGYTIKLVPEVMGGGIPYIEGVSRGKLVIRWFFALPAMFIASAASIFMGLSLGGEGPSMFIGGNVGYGVSKLTKTREQELRILTSAGACSGLAAAFGAPLAGILFSVEEAHKRFSPLIILPAIISVVTSILCLRMIFDTGAFLNFDSVDLSLSSTHIVGAVTTGIVGGLFGCLFTKLITKDFSSIINIPVQFKVLFPAALAIVAGLILPVAIGGGYGIISGIKEVSESGIGLIIAIFALKFLLTVLSSRSGASGGLFIPMLALGALIGALISLFLTTIGYNSSIVFLSLMGASAFFAASVHAPLTAVILIFEITYFDISSLLGIIIAVGAAYLVSQLLRSKPLYETMLEKKLSTIKLTKIKSEIKFEVLAESYAVFKHIEELVLPANCIITHIMRQGESFVPDGETEIEENDIITVVCERGHKADVKRELKRIFN